MKPLLTRTPLAAVRDTDSLMIKECAKEGGGRVAYANEMAGIVGMLVNPEAGYCTGNVVNANGGLTF